MRTLLLKAFRGQFMVELIVRARGLIILPIATRALGPVGYGQIAFAAALTGLVGTVATLGMPAALSRYLPGKEDDSERADLFWPSLSSAVTTAALFAGLTILAFAVLPLAPSGISMALIFVACLNVISNETKIFLFSFWRFSLELSGYYRFMMIDAVAAGAGQVVVLVVFNGGPVAIIAAGVAIDTLLLTIALVVLGRRLPWRGPTREVLMPLYKFGFPLGMTGLLNWANNTADRFFVQAFVGSAALGVYSVGYNLGFIAVSLIATPIFAVLSSVMFRTWDQGDKEGAQALLVRFSGILMVGSLPLIMSLQFFGEPVINTLAGPGFGDAHDYVLLVSLGYLTMWLGDLYGYPLWLHNRQYVYSMVMVASVVVNIGLNAILVPAYGAIGSAVATTASLTLLAVVLVIINLHNRYVRPPIFATLAIGALATAVWWITSLAWPESPNLFDTIGFSVFATVVFLAAAYPLRLLPFDPILLLREHSASRYRSHTS